MSGKDDGTVLGKGSFAVVRKGMYLEQIVAVKIPRISGVVSDESDEMDEIIEKFFDEIKLTAPLHHRNVINCLGGAWGEELSAGAASVGVCELLAPVLSSFFFFGGGGYPEDFPPNATYVPTSSCTRPICKRHI